MQAAPPGSLGSAGRGRAGAFPLAGAGAQNSVLTDGMGYEEQDTGFWNMPPVLGRVARLRQD